MQTATHGNGKGLNDLYILPDSPSERDTITQYLASRDIRFSLEISDTAGQDWYGREFIEIPFGEGLTSVIQQATRKAAQCHKCGHKWQPDSPFENFGKCPVCATTAPNSDDV